MSEKSLNFQKITELFCRLNDFSATDFVFCAGSRNAPLLEFALEYKKKSPNKVNVFHHYDERSASFFAMSLARDTTRKVVLCTTSGTAVSECSSAIIEAYYQGLSFIVLTADRPTEYRGSGAPQAIDQTNLYRDYAYFFDVQAEKCIEKIDLKKKFEKPIHINICLDEHKSTFCFKGFDWKFSERPSLLNNNMDSDINMSSVSLSDLSNPLFVVGALNLTDSKVVQKLLRKHNVSHVWSESHSNLNYKLNSSLKFLTKQPEASDLSKYSCVISVGGVPTLRLWRDLENLQHVPVYSFRKTSFSGLARPSKHFKISNYNQIDGLLSALRNSEQQGSLKETINLLGQSLPVECLVYLGNSLSIRLWDEMFLKKKGQSFFSNRGANGIDGQLSSFLALSETSVVKESWVVLGDLTTMYDFSALYILPQLKKIKRRYLVFNNKGGQVFEKLPYFSTSTNEFQDKIKTTHNLSFESFAKFWGLDYFSSYDSYLKSGKASMNALIEVNCLKEVV